MNLKDLKSIENWLSKDHNLPDLIGGLGVEEALKLLNTITGIDPEQEFNKARNLALDFLKKWETLDHEVASLLWKKLENNVDLDKIRTLAEKVANEPIANLQKWLEKQLQNRIFEQSDEAQIVITVNTEISLFDLISDIKALEKVKASAQKLLTVLDGNVLESLLRKLQAEINEQLSIDKINAVLTQADYDTMKGWLKSKIASFLDQKVNFAKVKAVQETIKVILAKRETFYQKAKEALNTTYKFNLSAGFQKTVSTSALIDLSLDFSAAGHQHKAVLRNLKKGNFGDAIIDPLPGVHLNKAVLSHGITRKAHVEIRLPFKGLVSVSKFNRTFADAKIEDQENGRLTVYELESVDKVARGARMSRTLTVGGFYSFSSQNRVRTHASHSLSINYSFREARPRMKTADLKYLLQPYVRNYFAKHFRSGAGASLDVWITNLDKTLDPINNTPTGVLGHTLLDINVKLPSELAGGWFKLTRAREKEQLRNMSKRIQRLLKQLIPFYFFTDEKILAAEPKFSLAVLAYASLPNLSGFTTKKGKIVQLENEPYWNPTDARVALVLSSDFCKNMFHQKLEQTTERLLNSPKFKHAARHYDPDKSLILLGEMIHTIKNRNTGDNTGTHLLSLTAFEKKLINGIETAAEKLLDFKEKGANPKKAVAAFARFGAKLSGAYNSLKLPMSGKNDWTGALSPLLYSETARAFTQGEHNPQTDALMDLIFLDDSSPKERKRFIENGSIPADRKILFEERIISM